MPTHYALDKEEKNVIDKIRNGVKPTIDPAEHELIYMNADRLYRKWYTTPGGRGQVLMPQDGIHYWLIIAAQELILEKLGIIYHKTMEKFDE